MRIGTIIRNDWASDRNPIKFFIYDGVAGKYINGLAIVDGKIERIQYYKKDFAESGKFVEVGFCDFKQYIKNHLEEARENNGCLC